MRIFQNCMEMVREVERDLYEMGIRVPSHTVQDMNVEGDERYLAMELHGYGYTLTSYEDSREMIGYMKGNITWAVNEFADRVSPLLVNPGTAWKYWPEVWKPFLHDGKFQYTYNQRMRDQLILVVKELQNKLFSRQAVMTIYDKHMDIDNWGGKARIPCSMYYQFLYRQNRLNLIYTMRSCDFLTHFAHDVFFATELLKWVSNEVCMAPGHFTHFIGSVHAFKKDLDERKIF